MPRLVLKFGGTSVANVDRIKNVARHVKARGRGRLPGRGRGVGHVRRDEPARRLVQGRGARSTTSREYDAVVASGEQVTSGLLAIALQQPWASRRAPGQGWQIPVTHRRGSRQGAHHRHSTPAIIGARPWPPARSRRSCRASRALSADGPHRDAGPRRLGHLGGRGRRGRSRPIAATSTPTSTASTPPIRGSSPKARTHRPGRPTKRCWRWRRWAPRSCRSRSVELAMNHQRARARS